MKRPSKYAAPLDHMQTTIGINEQRQDYGMLSKRRAMAAARELKSHCVLTNAGVSARPPKGRDLGIFDFQQKTLQPSTTLRHEVVSSPSGERTF